MESAFDPFRQSLGDDGLFLDKLFVLTPEGDLRILLDEGNPEKVNALEGQFLANHVTEEVLFATGAHCSVDGECDIRRAGLTNNLSRILEGDAHPVFSSPVAGLPMVHWNNARGLR